MDDDKILRLGGDENDISEYAKHNGADLTQPKSNDVNKFEEVDKEFDEIMLEWIESQWKIEEKTRSGEPYTRIKFEANAAQVEKKLLSLIHFQLSEAEKRGEEKAQPQIIANVLWKVCRLLIKSVILS